MKILHIDMTSPYTVGATYQENLLPAQHAKQGHQVVMYATSYEWSDGKVRYVGECRKTIEDGVVLQRIGFTKIINDYLSRKIRFCKGLYDRLVEEKPDFIMVHGGQTACVLDICKYVAANPHVVLIADSHSDYYNSATSLPSRILLHDLIYKPLMRQLYKASKRFYCISPEVMEFICKLYGLGRDKMDILPLGGVLFDEDVYSDYRKQYRKQLGIPDSAINIIHSGKMSSVKGSDRVIEIFDKIDNGNVHLTLVGAASGSILEKIELASGTHHNIHFMGWKSGDELAKYLCAADIYLLPWAQSATVQNAMCYKCAVEVYPFDNYRLLMQDELCYASDDEKLLANLKTICNDPQLLYRLRQSAFEYAKNKLDYAVQAEKIVKENI